MRRGRSLGARLLAFAGVTVAVALATAWLVLGVLFERHAERQLQAELERHGLALIAALEPDAQGRATLSARPFDPRFDRPASGLYWRISGAGGEVRSRSLWDGVLASPDAPPARGWGSRSVVGPFEDRVLRIARNVRLSANGPQILVEVAGDRKPLGQARADFGIESAVFLAVLWIALMAAAWVQVRLGLTPLDAVRRELEAMRRAPGGRMDETRHPYEVRPLTLAINDFAEARAADVQRARRRARDLAHALKTPLTALRLQIEALDPATGREMTHGLNLVSGAVEGELARAGGRSAPAQSANASVAIERLFAVIARTPDGARLALHNQVAPDVVLPLDEEAALEALGAVLENAARHAVAMVRATACDQGDSLSLRIADDGPGIPADLRASALGRGVRLDESAARSGLGLAIARDFVEASSGTLSLEDADEGGLQVVMTWPKRDGQVRS